MVNKKAQGMSINTIILIIIGLIVLVLLIVGFTRGWENLLPWIVPSNNVKDIASQCNLACSLNQKYDYCSVARDLKSETEEIKGVSCYVLAEKRTQYGIEACPAINCEIYDDLDKAKAACSEEGAEISYIDDLEIKIYTCLSEDVVTESE